MAADDTETTRAERVVLWQRATASLAPGVGDADRDADASATDAELQLRQWTERVASRLHASCADLLARVGATVIASFDSIELTDAIELARALVHDAEHEPEGLASHVNLQVNVGIAIGEVETTKGAQAPIYRGAAIDRAQALANAARGAEIVVDDDARAAASEHYLFGRQVHAGRVHGHALDLENPRKEDCRKALAQLASPPLARSAREALLALRELALRAEPQTRVVVRCATAPASLALVDGLATELPAPLRLRISRTAGGLSPLGSLALALRRAWPEDPPRVSATVSPATRAMLKALLRGQAVTRADMVEALAELLRACARGGARPWLILDQLHDIDPATLGVVAEAMLAPDVPCLLIMTLPLDGSVPAALQPKSELHELIVPPLPAAEARALAATILAVEETSPVAECVARLGGDSACGVLEAARTLVSAGDIVQRAAGGFALRAAPRGGSDPLPIEALITERALGLPPSAYRVLEALCLAPADASRELVASVTAHDGLDQAQLASGLLQLTAEGFVESGLSLGSAEAAIRAAVRTSMPPARAAELHRFLAAELGARQKAKGFGSAQVAYHLAEGGQEREAAHALLDAARAAVTANFQRVALRLSATAVELDGAADTQALAAEIASTVELPASGAVAEQATQPAAPAQPTSSGAELAMAAARKALVQRDYDAAERWLDGALAAGCGRAATQRMLAMTQLARGEAGEATLTLARSVSTEPSAQVQARDALGWALVHLETGDALRGVREALASLAHSRRLSDARGEAAALCVLAGCFAALGRDDDANAIGSGAAVA